MSAADLLLYNARVLTLEPQQPRAEVVAIRGGGIQAVGGRELLSSCRAEKTRLIDCEGGTLIPGFIDAHCHPLAFASSLLTLDCGPSAVRSIAEIQSRLQQQIAQVPPGTWIRGHSYDEFRLAERRHPTRWDLDKVSPRHPVILSHRSGHACVLNSLALQLAGISRETPDPPGGLIHRDLETGEPSGLLFEMKEQVEKVIPPLSQEEIERGIRLATEHYLSSGITSLHDATWRNSLHRWQLFQQLKSRGELVCRVSMMIGSDALEEFQERGLPAGDDSQLRVGAVKIVLDETTGSLYPSREELRRQIFQAHRAGFQIALHAIEDGVIEAAVKALEEAQNHFPRAEPRHRIEHCSLCPPRLMERLKETGVVVVTQPCFLYYSGARYLETVPPSQLRWLYPVGSLLGRGIKVAAGSDSPVAPPIPLIGIYTAVTRKVDTGEVVSPREGVSPWQALEMYTINAAYASFEERIKGTLAPGKLADLVLLSDDPTRLPPEEIKEIQVLLTLIGGKVVWEKR